MRNQTPVRLGVAVLAAVLLLQSCATRGLVRERYEPDFYQVPRLLETDELEHNPRFIVLGDNRPGYRGREFLAKRDTWVTWKQALVPFYQLYLLGSALSGLVNHNLRNAPDLGNNEAVVVRDAVYNAATSQKADFILHLGDLATDGRRAKHWERFLKQYKHDVPVVEEVPFLPVVGNHEKANDPEYGRPNYNDVFAYSHFYVVKSPAADIFVTDSNVIVDQDQFIPDAVQDSLFARWWASDDPNAPSWLERELEKSDAAFKIVAMHHPPISFGKHNRNWLSDANGNDLVGKRAAIFRVFAKYGVRVVFSGHQHMYEHSVLWDEDEEQPFHVIIAGGAGSPLHAAYSEEHVTECKDGYREEGFETACKTQQVVYNYLIVDVDEDQLTIDVFRVDKDGQQPDHKIDQIVVKP